MTFPQEFAIMANDKGMGDPRDPIQIRGFAAGSHGVADRRRRLFLKLIDLFQRFVRETENLQALFPVMVMHVVQMRDPLDAGAAPGGPEFDEHDLALQCVERVGLFGIDPIGSGYFWRKFADGWPG
jgi:hypothetical protein